MATWGSWATDTTSATNNNDDIYYIWNDATSTATTSITWATWSTATIPTDIVWTDWSSGYQLRTENAEEARLQRERQEQEAAVERQRADELLREHLTKEQIEQLDKKGEFEVEAQSGKRYAVSKGRAGNVYSLDERRQKIAKHCIHPDDNCPDQDTMLAQLLWLKWNESEFLRIANTTKLAA